MPLALILSSYVAAGRMGGGGQQLALAACAIDAVLAPTVLFGRSPAKGGKGQATDAELFGRMLEDIEAEGLFGLADLVITGHFSTPDQVELACAAIARVRAAPRAGAYASAPIVVVDPVMGDDPRGLYVRPEVAEAVAGRLVPLADWITPNAWELGRLSGLPVTDPGSALAAAGKVGRPTLVSSVPAGAEIGVVLAADPATLFAHAPLEQIPNGTGDLVTALFGAGLVEGLAPEAAAERAVRGVAEAAQAAHAWKAPELPLVALGRRLAEPQATIRLERLPRG